MRRSAATVFALALLAGCARFAGQRATEGALDTMASRATAGGKPGEVPFEAVAGKAVDGAISHLNEPENVAALRAVAGSVAQSAVERALAAATRPGAGAALASGMTDAARAAAVAAADGALARLLPACPAGDERCLDRRVHELARAAATGAAVGLRDSLGAWVVAAAFALGAATCAALFLAGMLLRRLRRAAEAHPPPAAPALARS